MFKLDEFDTVAKISIKVVFVIVDVVRDGEADGCAIAEFEVEEARRMILERRA